MLKIWEGGDPPAPIEPAPPGSESLAEELYRAEILRSPPRDLEPAPVLSLQWYLSAQQMRYQRQGHWLPASLEFVRHAGEKVLGLGGGLGSDWVGYAEHGGEVVAVCPSAEQRDIVQRNFDLRRLPGRCEQAAYYALPVPSASIDVVSVTGPLPAASLPATLDEVYRVLKPGGKLILVVPAARSIELLYRWLPGGRAEEMPTTSLLAGTRYTTGEMWRLLHRFNEAKISRRHLRRAEVPTLLRLTPLSLLERLAGRLLVFKGFKPLSKAKADQAAA
jgi:ubiquinone/menaquinone biosynthesis C-methylase UbiE